MNVTALTRELCDSIRQDRRMGQLSLPLQIIVGTTLALPTVASIVLAVWLIISIQQSLTFDDAIRGSWYGRCAEAQRP